MSNAADIAELRKCGANFRSAVATQAALWDQVHTSNVEAQILFKSDSPLDRETMVARLMQIDALTKGVFDTAKTTLEAIALLHEQQAEKLESQQ
jgi:hypothetical protein